MNRGYVQMNQTPPSRPSKAGSRILLGGVNFGTDDSPEPVLAVSCESEDEADNMAQTLLSVQDGVRPFPSGPDFYSGDNNIVVTITKTGKDTALVQIAAYADRRHLTCVYYSAESLPWDLVEPFLDLVDLRGQFTLTVACGEDLLLKKINLLKYVINKRGV